MSSVFNDRLIVIGSTPVTWMLIKMFQHPYLSHQHKGFPDRITSIELNTMLLISIITTITCVLMVLIEIFIIRVSAVSLPRPRRNLHFLENFTGRRGADASDKMSTADVDGMLHTSMRYCKRVVIVELKQTRTAHDIELDPIVNLLDQFLLQPLSCMYHCWRHYLRYPIWARGMTWIANHRHKEIACTLSWIP